MKLKLFSVLLFAATIAQAEIQTQTIEYKDGKTAMDGYLAYDDAIQGKRPAVLIVHDWMGPSAFTQDRAQQLAKMGYVVFAADIYGKTVRPKDAKEAMQQVMIYKGNRPLLRARVKAAFDVLLKQQQTDSAKVAAIGYCFGGTTVLELARLGAPLAGVVTFHGGLDTPTPQDAKNIKAKVLVLHGADDPHVPPEQVAAFEKEMNDAGVDWQLVKYSGTVHAFCIPTAGHDNSTGAAYNERSAKRAWQAMQDFFAEIFK